MLSLQVKAACFLPFTGETGAWFRAGEWHDGQKWPELAVRTGEGIREEGLERHYYVCQPIKGTVHKNTEKTQKPLAVCLTENNQNSLKLFGVSCCWIFLLDFSQQSSEVFVQNLVLIH